VISKSIMDGMEIDEWESLWDKMYENYPNIRGYIDIKSLFENFLDSLPELEKGIIVEDYFVAQLAETVANSLVNLLKVYDSILKNNGVGEVTS